MFVNKSTRRKINNILKKSQEYFDDMFQEELDRLEDKINELFEPVYLVRQSITDCISNQITEFDEIEVVWSDIINLINYLEDDVSREVLADKDIFLENIRRCYQDSMSMFYKEFVKQKLYADEFYLRKQLLLLDNFIVRKIEYFTNTQFKEKVSEVKQEMCYMIQMYNEYIMSLDEEDNIDIEHEETDNIKQKKKIFDYKTMDKFLLDNGFEAIRQKGSHKVYFNECTNKTTVVPQHKLGLGLSMKIQKNAL